MLENLSIMLLSVTPVTVVSGANYGTFFIMLFFSSCSHNEIIQSNRIWEPLNPPPPPTFHSYYQKVKLWVTGVQSATFYWLKFLKHEQEKQACCWKHSGYRVFFSGICHYAGIMLYALIIAVCPKIYQYLTLRSTADKTVQYDPEQLSK